MQLKNTSKTMFRILCIGLLLAITSCGGSSSGDDASPPTGGDTTNNGIDGGTDSQTGNGSGDAIENGQSRVLELRGTVQDIWTFDRLQIIDENAELIDITETLLAAYQADLGPEIPLSATATFQEISTLTPAIQSESGRTRTHISVVAGQLNHEDAAYLVAIATPDVTRGGLVGASDRLYLDITKLESSIAPRTPIVADYFFGVSTPGDSPDTDQSSGGAELLAERLAAGRFTLQTQTDEADSEPRLLTGNIGTTVEGSLGAGLPAKSLPLICGLPSSPGRSCGVFCLANNLRNIYTGFEGSLTALESNFGPGTGSSGGGGGSDCNCPPNSDCSNGGNDPHLKSFDGVSFSPQAVGEFDMFEYTGTDQSVRTQFRFSAIPGNRKVSFITAAAIGIDENRIIVTPNETSVLSFNGEAVSFNDMGEPVINGALYDNASTIKLSSPRGGIRIATPTFTWNFKFSNRGTDGTKFINFNVSIPENADGIQGLLGNANGSPRDDMRSRDNTFTLGSIRDASVADFYQRFVNTWRVTNESSLFDYAAGESTDTFTDLSFPDFPNLTNGDDTPLHTAIVDSSVDTSRAQAVCRASGITADPAFTECVTDVSNTGDFEIANTSQVIAGIARQIKQKRFGTEIDGKDLRWWHRVNGTRFNSDNNLVVNESLSLMSTTFADSTLLSAFDSDTGEALWEFTGVARCAPAFLGNDRVVVQLGDASEQNALVLLDAANGTELDRMTPETGSYQVCTDQLGITTDNRVIIASRFARYAFSVSNDAFTLDWEFDHETDPLTQGAAPRGRDLIHADDLYFSAEKDGVIVVYRVDTETGTAVAEFTTDLGSDNLLQTGADNLLVLSGNRDGIPVAIGITALPNDTTMSEAWSREFTDTITDSATRIFGKIARGSNGFAGWTSRTTDTGTEGGIAQFDLGTGLISWFAKTTSFDNNGQIVALDDGSFVVSPFGSANFLEAYNTQGDLAWTVNYPEGTDFPIGLASTGANSIVVVSRSDDKQAIVNVGTLRANAN